MVWSITPYRPIVELVRLAPDIGRRDQLWRLLKPDVRVTKLTVSLALKAAIKGVTGQRYLSSVQNLPC
ncbi:hypothetical protein MES5069_60104 [Mesorhizobium escarrei]|uniref:Uncharacterized protein n=1 Tax=Mesorhizobium escarrei TaxID=666018 RepID=A0ABN8KD01_9HYPH|nr:hypothetical protein MES5069_60104 [Mesorhizobium escarrei]